MEKDLIRTPVDELKRRFESAVVSAATLDPSTQRIVEIELDRIQSLTINGSSSEVEFNKMALTKFVESKLRSPSHRNGSNGNNGNER